MVLVKDMFASRLVKKAYCYIQWILAPMKYMGMGKRLLWMLEKHLYSHKINQIILQGVYEIEAFYSRLGFQ